MNEARSGEPATMESMMEGERRYPPNQDSDARGDVNPVEATAVSRETQSAGGRRSRRPRWASASRETGGGGDMGSRSAEASSVSSRSLVSRSISPKGHVGDGATSKAASERAVDSRRRRASSSGTLVNTPS